MYKVTLPISQYLKVFFQSHVGFLQKDKKKYLIQQSSIEGGLKSKKGFIFPPAHPPSNPFLPPYVSKPLITAPSQVSMSLWHFFPFFHRLNTLAYICKSTHLFIMLFSIYTRCPIGKS